MVEKKKTNKPEEVTAESAIRAFTEANCEIQIRKLEQMVADAREKCKGYEQIAKVHSAYISILLKRMGATEEKPVTITKTEIKEALEHYEARGIPVEDGYSLYCEVIDDGGVQAETTAVKREEKN